MELIQHLTNALKDCLTENAIKGELIEVSRYVRGIGKTTALISFSKSYGFPMIVANKDVARHLIKYYYYENIYGQEEIQNKRAISGSFKCTIDEGVDLDKLKSKNLNLTIVTGFVTV